MSRANYNCSQNELYQGLDLLAASLEEHLARFAEHKAKYDIAFVNAFKADIDAARLLPNEQQRTADTKVLHEELEVRLAEEMIPRMNSLRSYIEEAYSSPTVQRIRLSEAGFDEMDKVRASNWDTVKGVLTQALSFITLHSVELSNNNNMPVTFPVAFQDLKEEMIFQINTFMNLRDNAPVGTSGKIDANNDVYAQGMKICKDGQIVFAREEALRQQFTWADIMDLVTPPGAAGLKIFVRDGVTFLARANAEIKIQRPGEPVITLVTDEDGFVYFTNLPVGTYVGNITGAGYPEFNFEVTIELGVTSTKRYDTMPL